MIRVKGHPKKYALHPGYITSRSDKQRHFVGVTQLVQLFGVKLENCIIWDESKPETFAGRDYRDYIHLFPMSSGNYAKQD